MLFLVIFLLHAFAQGRNIDNDQQRPLTLENSSIPREIPGDSIVKLCPESLDTNILKIDKILNRPEPILDEEIDIFIWGSFSRDISPNSTVDFQINATANTGDYGFYNGTFSICDYLEQTRQLPDLNVTKACPPHEGSVFIDYAAWFAYFLTAPGNWSMKFDAKTPEGERIYCLQTEFDLQCPPERDDYRCLRNLTDTLDIPWMMKKSEIL
ncbi:uncharacterized protein EAF02_011923 [Botrytis sinoallii]|uniref:uncharacterized protein n=1 Tax=Botrytis sinoallii TaxID=1463999 RepID=UPI0018FFC10D|nr:uncharacterized protein EAF02_011923 [Botrytis sinoallii]KAF7853618.1 hypothetical protein EAF02_011923 [Botrytis sinoallii]